MTTFGGQTIPPLLRRGTSGSFFTPPVNLYDQVVQYTGNAAFDAGIRFQPLGLFQLVSPAVITLITTLPQQWFTNAPIPPPPPTPTSVRVIAENGPDAWVVAPPGYAIGVWFPINTNRNFSVDRPPGIGQTFSNEAVFELAETANLGTILARATIDVRYTRT